MHPPHEADDLELHHQVLSLKKKLVKKKERKKKNTNMKSKKHTNTDTRTHARMRVCTHIHTHTHKINRNNPWTTHRYRTCLAYTTCREMTVKSGSSKAIDSVDITCIWRKAKGVKVQWSHLCLEKSMTDRSNLHSTLDMNLGRVGLTLRQNSSHLFGVSVCCLVA